MAVTVQKNRQRTQLATLLADPDAFALTLITIFVDTYGMEALAWAPETVRLEIIDDFQVDLPQENFDKLMAAMHLSQTDEFYVSLPTFIEICNVLNGDAYDPMTWDPADAEEITWGITEAMLIMPPENEESPFAAEIQAYIAEIVDDEGIVTPPDVLRLSAGDADKSGYVKEEFSDDPMMWQMIYESGRSKSENVTKYLKTNLMKLLNQLGTLSLKNGDTKEAVRKMSKSIG